MVGAQSGYICDYYVQMALQAKNPNNRGRVDQQLGYLALHLDELESLVEMWKTKYGTVTLDVGDMDTSKALDLRGATAKQIRKLTIELTNPKIIIQLKRKRAEINYQDNVSAKAAVHDIITSLKPYKRWIPYRKSSGLWIWFATTVMFFLVFAAKASAPKSITGWQLLVFFSAFLLMTAMLPLEFHALQSGTDARIIRATRSERSIGFERNRSQWFISAISAVFGIIIGYLLGK